MQLSPEDVMKMPLDEFEQRFGFRPVDALEKKWFAVIAKRILPIQREMIAAGILDDVGSDDLSNVVMD